MVNSAAYSPDGKFIVTAGWDADCPHLGRRHRPRTAYVKRPHRLGQLSRLQPRRQVHRHRQSRRDRPHLGRRHRPGTAYAQRPHRLGQLSRLQPRRQVHRHRQRGPYRPHLGRRHRPGTARRSSGHTGCGQLSRLQPRRQVHRHRQSATRPPASGTPPPARNSKASAHLAATPTGSTRPPYSPDGKFIVTASTDETARIWDAATGQQFRSLSGHTNAVNSAAYSPDGKFIVTASSATTPPASGLPTSMMCWQKRRAQSNAIRHC